MKVTFRNSKDNECYREFVENPQDRKKKRSFEKKYGKALTEPSIKLHQRIIGFENAEEYNKIYGATNNRIELFSGGRDKDPLVLKTRVTSSYRAFFYYICCVEKEEYLKKKDWTGQFAEVCYLLVITVNNHDYNAVS